jgi:hypothetical protein
VIVVEALDLGDHVRLTCDLTFETADATPTRLRITEQRSEQLPAVIPSGHPIRLYADSRLLAVVP